MIQHLMIFIEAFSLIASAATRKDAKEVEIDPCARRLVDSRFVAPEMNRLIPLEQTASVFRSLTEQLLQDGAQIYSRNIRIQKLLVEEFNKPKTRIMVQLVAMNWPGMLPVSKNPDVLLRTVGAGLIIRLPSIKRGFADRLIPRQDILNQMRAAAKKMGPTTAITEKAVANWVTDSERGSDLFIDLTGLTHPEFDLVANTIARQLSILAK